MAYRRRKTNCNIPFTPLLGVSVPLVRTLFEESIQHILKYYILGYQNHRHGDGLYVFYELAFSRV